MRGLTLGMLEELADLIENVLSAGYKITDGDNGGSEVTMETINLYHIVEHFVMPLTKKDRCSFVELATKTNDGDSETTTPAPPRFFVSHWWGTPLVDTIQMLKLHEKKGLTMKDTFSSDYSVWICAFSNRQHNLAEEELDATNYLSTPFAKALMSEQCRGTVLLLNEKNATALTRSWCIFEAFVSLTHCQNNKRKRHRMDIATIIPEGHCSLKGGKKNRRCAGLLTEVSLFISPDSENGRAVRMRTDHSEEGNATSLKAFLSLNAWFPFDLALLGMHVNILQAESSQALDQERITTWVGDNVDDVNLALRRKFLPPALHASSCSCDPEMLQQVVECAQSLVSREDLLQLIRQLDLVGTLFRRLEKEKEISGCIDILIGQGWDPNRPDIFINSVPLGTALSQKQYAVARHLLENGADPAKLRSVNLLNINYAECPDDIMASLRESGVVCKGRCLRFFWLCSYCWRLCCCCFKAVLTPNFFCELCDSMERTE